MSSAAMRRPSAGFFRWEDPGEPVAVHFHLNTIELMERDAIRAGNIQSAGILLGKRDDTRHLSFMVENYEPIPIPTWKSTDSPFGDRRQLRAMIDRWQARTDKRLTVLGFYRNGGAEETGLSADDLSIIADNSGQLESIFLLIQPRVGKSSVGRLFAVRNGAAIFEWSPTPFNRSELSGRGMPRTSEPRPVEPAPVEPRPVESRPAAIEKSLPARVGEAPQRRAAASDAEVERGWEMPKKFEWAIGALVAVLLLSLGIYIFRGAPNNPASGGKTELSGDSGLGLHLDRSGTDWRLSWDPNSAAILRATHGQLLISDGTLNKTVDLDASDLKSGTIIYSPLTDDVVLRLQVSSDDSAQPISESIRVVGGLPAGAGLSAGLNSSTEGITAPVETVRPILSDEQLRVLGRTAPVATSRGPQIPDSYATQYGSELRRGVASKPYEPIRKSNNSGGIPPRAEAGSTRPAPLKAKPQTAPAQMAAVSRNDIPNNNAAHVVAPVSVGMKATAETIPVIPAKASELALDSVTRPTRRGGMVQPAQLISNINPTYPSAAKVDGVAGTVELRFKIGPTGEVHDISVVKGPAILAQAAVQAVRDRKYKPARVDGVPTETDASAIFDFKLN